MAALDKRPGGGHRPPQTAGGDGGYDASDTTLLAADLSTDLTTAVTSGTLASNVAANAGDSAMASAVVDEEASSAAIVASTSVTKTEARDAACRVCGIVGSVNRVLP